MNFLSNLLLVFFLVHYNFSISEAWFTGVLVFILFLVSVYIGASSEQFGQLNGSLVGIVSAFILFAFLVAFVDLNWVLNAWIVAAWLTIGYIGGFVGYKLVKKKKVNA